MQENSTNENNSFFNIRRYFTVQMFSADRSTIPFTYADIADRSDSDEWYKCSDDEIAQLLTEETWELLPSVRRLITLSARYKAN